MQPGSACPFLGSPSRGWGCSYSWWVPWVPFPILSQAGEARVVHWYFLIFQLVFLHRDDEDQESEEQRRILRAWSSQKRTWRRSPVLCRSTRLLATGYSRTSSGAVGSLRTPHREITRKEHEIRGRSRISLPRNNYHAWFPNIGLLVCLFAVKLCEEMYFWNCNKSREMDKKPCWVNAEEHFSITNDGSSLIVRISLPYSLLRLRSCSTP